MTRTNIDLDDELCRRVVDRFDLSTKREAVNLALRHLAGEPLRGLSARATMLRTTPADYEAASALHRACRAPGETVRKLIDSRLARAVPA